MIAHQIRVIGMHEIGHRFADETLWIGFSDERCEMRVREHDAIAMHRNGLVQSAEQPDQRTLALGDHQFLHRDLLEQPIRALRERRSIPAVAYPFRKASRPNDALKLIRGTHERIRPTHAPSEYHEQAQQHEDRDR